LKGKVFLRKLVLIYLSVCNPIISKAYQAAGGDAGSQGKDETPDYDL